MPDVTTAAGATAQPASTDPTSAGQPSTTAQPFMSQPTTSTPPPASPGAPPASATARAADTWVAPPRERWLETERGRREAFARAEKAEALLEQERRRVQALSGVTPQKPEDAQRQQVAEA